MTRRACRSVPGLSTASPTSGGRGRGFTLVETIVAVGLLAVITVAVAAVFQTVGDTVTTGKRLSGLNRRAAQLERVMRDDLDRLVRDDGFMVIRNEYAQGDWDGDATEAEDAVRLFDPSVGLDGPEPRLRRIDELMFFIRGEATTARPPLHPSRTATAGSARVYYGHGQKYPEFDGSDPRAVRPTLDETNAVVGARLGERTSAFVNPNEFASSWSLLRHQTLLVSLDELNRDAPPSVFHLDGIGIPRTNRATAANVGRYLRVKDTSRQVAFQPAAQSIFRSVAALTPDRPDETVGADPNVSPGSPVGIRPPRSVRSPRLTGSLSPADVVLQPGDRAWTEERDAAPLFTSGLVDIATTSLAEIKAQVTSPYDARSRMANPVPATVTSLPLLLPDDLTRPNLTTGPAGISGIQAFLDAAERSYLFPARTVYQDPTVRNGTTLRQDQVQQQWMLDALPSVPFREDFARDTGFRIRYDDDPPRLFGDDAIAANEQERLLLDAIEQADQEMLRSSVFLQGCSEFIVEWTYGIVDNNVINPNNAGLGQPLWYGLRRFEDRNDNGRYDRGAGDILIADQFRARRYGDNTLESTPDYSSATLQVPPELLEAAGVRSLPAALDRLTQAVSVRPVPMAAVTAPDNLYEEDSAPHVEYVFGYSNVVSFDRTNQAAVEVRDLPWPKLIRVTVRLVDPTDPTVEATYQATFRVPGRSGV